MSKIFSEYAKYYDIFYRDKNYQEEARYVAKLIKKYCREAKTVLDLGCGTGIHASLLTQCGFDVFGVDVSSAMLERARNIGIKCEEGDVRNFRTNKKFDAVISLFHVASYQSTNEDLISYFRTAAAHLAPGGIFIFDCWYGPLSIKPESRIKFFEDEKISIKRVATPTVYLNENIIDVNYEVSASHKEVGDLPSLKETHRMRYLFTPETKLMLEIAGFCLQKSEEWLTSKEPNLETWSVVFLGIKK